MRSEEEIKKRIEHLIRQRECYHPVDNPERKRIHKGIMELNWVLNNINE